MFEVLAFVYENCLGGDARPEPLHLERKLSAVGFETDEIHEAMDWLTGLSRVSRQGATAPWLIEPHPHSLRVYSAPEQKKLGAQCIGFLGFLGACTALTAHMREAIIDRAMATPASPVALDDFKIIVLLVFWSFGLEPDALVLDELCDSSAPARCVH